MDEYMAAVDLLIGKPGALTTSEALARNLAMVIVNPIPGQEEGNADCTSSRKGRPSAGTTSRPWPGSSTGCSTTRHA
jgi:hypothetical protein